MGFKTFVKGLSLKNLLASVRDSQGQSGRYYRWGNLDNFPNTVIDSANDSGTARECIDKLEAFIAGEGIADENFLKGMANPKQTWGQLLEAINRQLAYFDAITLQVKFNAAGLPQRYYLLPVQYIRRRHDGDFIYREGLGDEPGYHMYRKTDKVIPEFGTNKTPQEIRKLIGQQKAKYGEQLGELLYIYTPGVGLNYQYYPIPKWTAGLNDINADAGLSLHEESQVANSFKAGVIVQTRPLDRTEILAGTQDDHGNGGLTEFEVFENNMNAFCSPDGSPIFHIESIVDYGNGQSAGATVTPLNIQHQMDATEKATDRIGRKVCRLFGVPPVLCGFATAGKLGDNQEIVNNMELFNLTLKRKWALKERMFATLFPDVPIENFETKPLNLFKFIPEKVIDKMTPKQLNEVYELPEDEQGVAEQESQIAGEATTQINREVNENLKQLTGRQQQQLDRIVRKFDNEKLTEAKAIMQLVGGFGFTEDEARAYLEIESEGDGTD